MNIFVQLYAILVSHDHAQSMSTATSPYPIHGLDLYSRAQAADDGSSLDELARKPNTNLSIPNCSGIYIIPTFFVVKIVFLDNISK